MIPKPSGGMRKLGVPAAVDRLICQAIAQVLTPVFDPCMAGSAPLQRSLTNGYLTSHGLRGFVDPYRRFREC